MLRLAVAIALPWALAALVFGKLDIPLLTAGSCLAVLNAITASAINRRAIRSRSTAFLAWSLGGNGVRMLTFLSLIMTGCVLLPDSGPFLVAVFGAFVILYVFEIALLHRRSLEEMKNRKIQP